LLLLLLLLYSWSNVTTISGGWFAPVSAVLDHITAQRGEHVLTPRERAALENKWLWHKLRHGES
jgi:hypothetical protein